MCRASVLHNGWWVAGMCCQGWRGWSLFGVKQYLQVLLTVVVIEATMLVKFYVFRPAHGYAWNERYGSRAGRGDWFNLNIMYKTDIMVQRACSCTVPFYVLCLHYCHRKATEAQFNFSLITRLKLNYFFNVNYSI